MSDIDLSAAASAAVVTIYPAHDPDDTCDGWQMDVARDAVTAAAPLIEAAVREQVAREIEAHRIEYDRASRLITRGNPSSYDQGITDAYDLAARIARGDS